MSPEYRTSHTHTGRIAYGSIACRIANCTTSVSTAECLPHAGCIAYEYCISHTYAGFIAYDSIVCRIANRIASVGTAQCVAHTHTGCIAAYRIACLQAPSVNLIALYPTSVRSDSTIPYVSTI
eukprot:197471-Rhodomonas_salina.2